MNPGLIHHPGPQSCLVSSASTKATGQQPLEKHHWSGLCASVHSGERVPSAVPDPAPRTGTCISSFNELWYFTAGGYTGDDLFTEMFIQGDKQVVRAAL